MAPEPGIYRARTPGSGPGRHPLNAPYEARSRTILDLAAGPGCHEGCYVGCGRAGCQKGRAQDGIMAGCTVAPRGKAQVQTLADGAGTAGGGLPYRVGTGGAHYTGKSECIYAGALRPGAMRNRRRYWPFSQPGGVPGCQSAGSRLPQQPAGEGAVRQAGRQGGRVPTARHEAARADLPATPGGSLA